MEFDMSLCEVSLENLLATPEGKRVLSCIQCGVCRGTCPHGFAMQYPPRKIIGFLKAGMIDRVISNPDMLLCVSCYSCMNKCPRKIQLTNLLLPLVKEKVFENLGEVPPELQKALENTFRYGNPFGESPKKRQEWVKEAGVPVRIFSQDNQPADILWWVECYSSYTPRGTDTAVATAKILNALNLDFAILGNEEMCAGECARLVGETGLFDTVREKNLKTYKKYRFNKIVTSGVHAYDALKYRYPCNDFSYPVEQMTPFLAGHINRLTPLFKKRLDDYVVTYHDSCVLGRHNGFYEEPRALLRAIPGLKLVEMAHNRENGLCCGGGGGGMWLDTYFKMMGLERLSEKRVKEAVAAGADVIAVSCHYEISRFEDAIKVLGYDQKIIVRDVVELLLESMEG